MTTPKEAQPFLPRWRAGIGPLREEGSGLLSACLVRQKDLLDYFAALMGSFTLTVKPQAGEIWADSLLVHKGAPAKLLWFRRMGQEVGSLDRNSSAPRCLFYGVGLDGAGGRVGYRIAEDGSAEWSTEL